jgi:hypothetical protein
MGRHSVHSAAAAVSAAATRCCRAATTRAFLLCRTASAAATSADSPKPLARATAAAYWVPARRSVNCCAVLRECWSEQEQRLGIRMTTRTARPLKRAACSVHHTIYNTNITTETHHPLGCGTRAIVPLFSSLPSTGSMLHALTALDCATGLHEAAGSSHQLPQVCTASRCGA